eukprot:1765714-Pleurochrysis_carterae.AAC.1
MTTIPDLLQIRSLHFNDRNLQIGRLVSADYMSIPDALVPTRSAILTYLNSLNIRGLRLGSAAYEDVSYATLEDSVRLVTGTSLLNYLSSLNIRELPFGSAAYEDVNYAMLENSANLFTNSPARQRPKLMLIPKSPI